MNRSQHLRNLLVMALADGSLGEREVNFVSDQCAALGLGESDLRDAVKFALDDNASISLPSDPTEQEALIRDLLRTMAADGMLAEKEKRLFAVVAAKLNFDIAKIDLLIDQMSLK
jgi:uncharacterized tellurite resistance protein B-like protein